MKIKEFAFKVDQPNIKVHINSINRWGVYLLEADNVRMP
jgi:hypothetical protein